MHLNQRKPIDHPDLLRVGEAWRNSAGLITLLVTYFVAGLFVVYGARGGSTTFALALVLTMVGLVTQSLVGLSYSRVSLEAY
jgi:hypothetical protein